MVLRADDTEMIAQYCATHDPGLREEIILRYVPLVHYVLGRLGFSLSLGADYDDAASQSLLGLIEAVDRYEPIYGTQFSTYATLRIRGRAIDHLRSRDWLSRGARKRARQVQQGKQSLFEKLQRIPTEAELAEALSLDLPKVQRALVDSSRIILSLDAEVNGGSEEEANLHELLPDDDQVEPSKVLEEEELKSILADTLRELPKREQLILSLYYYDELTFKEIGAVLEISESRVCQLHSHIVTMLKNMITQRTQPDQKIFEN
jgi:RNA polymerase sigma factor for flagellar operon FliA